MERLRIENYQAHRELDLVLDEPVTTIVGSTDSGKSSVVRALRWLCLNRPRGTAFISDGEKSCRVKAKFGNTTVERGKGKENRYRVGKKVYTAFGDSVPEEVAMTVNVSDINFQRQHDAPFWFSLSPGEVARQLNSIVDLEVIDDVLGRTAARLRKARDRVELGKDRVKKADDECERLSFVPTLVEQFHRLETEEEQAAARRTSVAILGRAVLQAIEYRERAESLRNATLAAVKTATTGRLANDLSSRLESLVSLISSASKAKKAMGNFIPVVEFSELDETRDIRSESLARLELLKRLTAGADRHYSDHVRLDDQAEKVEQQIRKEFKGRCPLCGSALQGE